jgi:3-deoxy-D-manno-octulosonic-acid transferase
MSLKQEKILIFQIASLGDTTVSVPVYREIARRHPDADRYLLTSFPTGVKCTTAEAILRPMGLINGTIEYPMPLRSVAVALQLQQKIRTLRPTKLYYLAAMVSRASLSEGDLERCVMGI